MIARENKREKLVQKYAEKRKQLKEVISKSGDFDEVIEAQVKLQKLPKGSNKSRLVNRCAQCGRPHAVYKKFGLCRICLRKNLMQGDVPGGKKASW